jgi:hypothetical protein
MDWSWGNTKANGAQWTGGAPQANRNHPAGPRYENGVSQVRAGGEVLAQ